jgi:hypothetical protein
MALSHSPAKEGRYRFTLAHEGGGHWRLHRHLFAKDPTQAVLFGGSAAPSIICRSSQAKEPVEWQADFYASCLLMPRKLIFETWRERFGTTAPFIFEINKSNPIFAPRRSNWIHRNRRGRQKEPDHVIEAVILNSSGFYLFVHKTHSIIRPVPGTICKQTSLRDSLPKKSSNCDRSM